VRVIRVAPDTLNQRLSANLLNKEFEMNKNEKKENKNIELYPPGSDKAVKKGCKCPILDNEYGAGYMGQKGIYCMIQDCPLHGYKI
jgi:hypothetical protein